MILSVTFSKPVKNLTEILGNDYTRVKIKLVTASASDAGYFAEFFTQKQVFHKKLTEEEVLAFIKAHAGTSFKSCVQRTDSEEITVLANKKGKITELRKKLKDEKSVEKSPLKKLLSGNIEGTQLNKKKNYLLPEGNPVPFMVHLGIMTAEGKVIASKYDKFRQINRFLEFVNDILPALGIGGAPKGVAEGNDNPAKPDGTVIEPCERTVPERPEKLSIVDFGSGKSYLTFAVQYFLTEVKKVPCEIFGLDLKKDVIDYCSSLAEKLNLKNLSFAVGDIASFGEDRNPDVIITLHACDTATDYALNYAIKHNARAILSVPCCQHEINSQLNNKSAGNLPELKPLLKYGLIKERFSALLTDALRGELLEQHGYKVQMLEFIDDNATPKNLMIRAVKAWPEKNESAEEKSSGGESLLVKLGVSQTLLNLLEK